MLVVKVRNFLQGPARAGSQRVSAQRVGITAHVLDYTGMGSPHTEPR